MGYVRSSESRISKSKFESVISGIFKHCRMGSHSRAGIKGGSMGYV